MFTKKINETTYYMTEGNNPNPHYEWLIAIITKNDYNHKQGKNISYDVRIIKNDSLTQFDTLKECKLHILNKTQR